MVMKWGLASVSELGIVLAMLQPLANKMIGAVTVLTKACFGSFLLFKPPCRRQESDFNLIQSLYVAGRLLPAG
jgi:hypothetical protein